MTSRRRYRAGLDALFASMAVMADQVATAVQLSTKALLTIDLQSAERVIREDDALDTIQLNIEQRAVDLLALQTPVASDLRLIVTAFRIVADLERMGDLAAHVAKVSEMRYPEPAIPEDLANNFARAGELAYVMTTAVSNALARRTLTTAEDLAREEAEMDDLRRVQFRTVLARDWGGSVETAVDVALLGRYFERIGDHAVTVARRSAYVMTGDPATLDGVHETYHIGEPRDVPPARP